MKRVQKGFFAVVLSICLVLGHAGGVLATNSQIDSLEAQKEQIEEVASFDTTAESAILIEPKSGTIIYEKDIHKQLPPASVTKLMTLLIAVEAVESGKATLQEKVVASEYAAGYGGSQIYLKPGEEFPLEEMLLAVAVQSANDASVAVAEHIGGTHEEFVALMNQRAKELGLKDTAFKNCNGLPAEGHVTSAHDLALLLKKAMEYPLYKKLSSVKFYDLRGGDFQLVNTNKLLWWYEGTDAGKTGWTREAKYCLASSVERDGLRLIAVVLGTAEPRSQFRESIKLYNYGFAKFRGVVVAKQGQQIKKLPVEKGKLDKLEVVTKDKVSAITLKGKEKEINHEILLPKAVEAPIKKGQKIGEIVVKRGNEKLYSMDLVANQSVEKADFGQHFEKVLLKTFGAQF